MNGTSDSCKEMLPVFPEAVGWDVAEVEASLICFLDITHVMMISLKVVALYQEYILSTSYDA